MRGSTKYPEVERMLRRYRDGVYLIPELSKKLESAKEEIKQLDGLRATMVTDMPTAHRDADRMYELYVNQIEVLSNDIKELDKEITELRRIKSFVTIKLAQMGAMETAVIDWKYKDRMPEKMILYKLRKEFGVAYSHWSLFYLLETIHIKLK